MKSVIVGNRGGTNIGGCFEAAAGKLGADVRLVESRLAMQGSSLIRRWNWWFRGRRPPQLDSFSEEVLQVCSDRQAAALIVTGITPPSEKVLRRMAGLGIRRINYLTDDPWNPAHRAPWFLKALPNYDVVFTPRRGNISDLRALGCPAVEYLPFGYSPDLHFVEPPSPAEQMRYSCDIVFAGGADSERASVIRSLVQAGFKVSLYGDYWKRYRSVSACDKGYADVVTLRKAVAGAKLSLGLVRRANRDGHSMRTFEIPAMGGCMLTEDTPEHREIFGSEGERTVYFNSRDEMIRKARWLLDHEEERRRLASAARDWIVSGKHTYADRLRRILNLP